MYRSIEKPTGREEGEDISPVNPDWVDWSMSTRKEMSIPMSALSVETCITGMRNSSGKHLGPRSRPSNTRGLLSVMGCSSWLPRGVGKGSGESGVWVEAEVKVEVEVWTK